MSNGNIHNLGGELADVRQAAVDSRVVSEINNTLGVAGDAPKGIGVGAAEPISLDEAKNYVRITNVRDDELIPVLITSARRQAEQYLNSDIVPKQRVQTFGALLEPVNLYYAPIATVDSVTFDGTAQVEDTGYELIGLDNPKIVSLSAAAEDVEVTYTTRGLLNAEIKSGILALFAFNYKGRDTKVFTNWESFLSPFKNYGFYGVR